MFSNWNRYIRCQGTKNQVACWHWFHGAPLGLLVRYVPWMAAWYVQLRGSVTGSACMARTPSAYPRVIGSQGSSGVPRFQMLCLTRVMVASRIDARVDHQRRWTSQIPLGRGCGTCNDRGCILSAEPLERGEELADDGAEERGEELSTIR